LALIFVSFVVILIFLLQIQLVNKQKEKEIEVIQQQQNKEEAILKAKTQQQELVEANKMNTLDSCLKQAALNMSNSSVAIGLFSQDQMDDLTAEITAPDKALLAKIDEYEWNSGICSKLTTKSEESCLIVVTEAQKSIKASYDKDKADCYLKYK